MAVDPNSDSYKKFHRALDEALDELPEQANDIKAYVALNLLNRIVQKTPVDTGRARGNWQLSLRTPAEGEVANAEEQTPASVVIEGENEIANVAPGETIWISNNLPYIGRLEEGWSQQAPQGMVALSLAEVSSGLELE